MSIGCYLGFTWVLLGCYLGLTGVSLECHLGVTWMSLALALALKQNTFQDYHRPSIRLALPTTTIGYKTLMGWPRWECVEESINYLTSFVGVNHRSDHWAPLSPSRGLIEGKVVVTFTFTFIFIEFQCEICSHLMKQVSERATSEATWDEPWPLVIIDRKSHLILNSGGGVHSSAPVTGPCLASSPWEGKPRLDFLLFHINIKEK